jgi:hypothetical protein
MSKRLQLLASSNITTDMLFPDLKISKIKLFPFEIDKK